MRVPLPRLQRRMISGAVVVSLLTLGLAPAASAEVTPGAPVVINEVYGGGGNSGATLKRDFVELFNPGTGSVDLAGWAVQYASATGATWATTPLSGSLAAGDYLLVGEAAGTGGTQDLPVDVDGSIALSGTAGKVALTSSAVALTCSTGCATQAAVVDLIGYGSTASSFAGTGPAAAPANPTSVSRTATHTNTADNAADFTVGAPTPTKSTGVVTPPDPGGDKTIAEIQGTGAASPLAGQSVTTTGVVTAAYPSGGFNGYTIQTPGTGGPLDLATHTASDGLFVFSSATVPAVHLGEYVKVTGTVSEFNGLTELTVAAAGLTQLSTAHDPVTAATTTGWPASVAQRESLESMLYRPTGHFTVTNTYSTNQFGEVGLAAGDKPLIQPTDVARPGSAEAAAITADNAARAVTLDDGASTNFLSAANSGLTPPYLSLTEPVRVSERVTFTKDVVVDFRNSAWKFQPTSQVTPADTAGYPATFANNREATPNAAAIGAADLRVTSFNVQNYFTTLGADVAGCTSFKDRDGNPITVNTCPGNGPRGAWDEVNLARQQAKIVTAINSSGADVAGLEEIENSAVLGDPTDSALATLVDALNAKAGAGTWAYVPSSTELPPTSQMDVINSAIIYKPAAVARTGPSRALGTQSVDGTTDHSAFANAREPIGQIFTPKQAGGAPFLFVVNHFKSKGSAGPWPGDTDSGDGQSASNQSRVRQATALRDWIPTVLAGSPAKAVVMVGDYNSYGQEDPITVLTDAGYTDAESHFQAQTGTAKYSYSFSGLSGSLDHVLVNADALGRATGVDTWNINSPESIALNYSRYNYHGTLFWDPTVPYAASDHDPVVLGLRATTATRDLTLLNINDFHGRIDTNTVKFAGTIEKLRAAGGEGSTALLAAGDNIGASLFASASAKDQPTIDVLNALDLKASAVGNHEFDQGYHDLIDRVINGGTNATWKYLGANVYQKGTQTPALPEYQILDLAGVKVGIIGAVTQETPSLVSPAGITGLDFGDPVAAVNRVSAELTDGDPANGEADVLVAEYHEGAGAGTPDGATLDQELAAGGAFAEIVTKTSAKVSAIFTGHTHQQYVWDAPVPGAPDRLRPILQTGSYGENIGQIVLHYDTATKSVTGYQAQNVARTTDSDDSLVATYPRVAAVKTITDKALADAAVIGNQPVGSVTADITTAYSGTGAGYTGPGGTYVAPTRDDRSKESTLGNLVADSLLSSLSPADRGGAEIGVVNPGGLRSELLYAPDGSITYAEANSVLPFVNNLWTTSLTGAQVKTLLEQQWQTNPDGSVPTRPYLQLGLSKNVTYTFDSTRAAGDRITSVTVNGASLDPARSYRIGTFSFLTSGGDNFRVFTAGTNAKDSGLIDRDAWIQYLRDHPGLSPDFARHAVEVTGAPGSVPAGSTVAFAVKGLDLTSLGSPQNTSLSIRLGGTALGSTGVTGGAAAVSVTVPAGTPAGATALTLVAAPSGTTVTVPLTVTAPAKTATTTTLTASGTDQVWGWPFPIGLTAAVTAADGSAVTGAVEFRSGDTVLGSAPVTSGVAWLTLPVRTPPGNPAVRAVYLGSTTLAGSTSPPVTLHIAKAPSVTGLTAIGTSQKFRGALRVVLVAGVVVPFIGSASGSVRFTAGGTVLGTVRVRSGAATLTLPKSLPIGSYRITATFVPTDAAHIGGSTSNVVAVTVR